MSIDRIALILTVAFALPATTRAQAPMSAIEWLDREDSLVALRRPQDRTAPDGMGRMPDPMAPEPPVSEGASVPQVSVKPLDQIGDGPIGLMPTSVTGLPETLWRGSDPARLARMLEQAEFVDLPAMQALLYSLLLTEALPPAAEDGPPVTLLARIDKLTEMGAVEPAQALTDHAGTESDPALFARAFELALLAGTEDEACARMAARPDLAPDMAARVYCLARMGDWQAAMVTFSSMRALKAFSPRTEHLLSQFLEPELIEQSPQLAPSAEMSPLVFRLEEAIGQPPSTATLPRPYAIADLRDVSGWKAELEAVERLVRTGALSENRLLGVYTAREPAASGGIWDRVAAFQAFDAALEKGNAQEVSDTVTAAWAAMREARLEVPFARLYGARLAEMDLPGRAAKRAAFRIALLSPQYESASRRMVPEGEVEAFLAAVAQGDVADVRAPSSAARAVAAGFDPVPVVDADTAALLREDRLGEAILSAMRVYASAMAGDSKDATRALTALRVLGLEDTARRAALQFLILDRKA